jgi:hypothetical protein
LREAETAVELDIVPPLCVNPSPSVYDSTTVLKAAAIEAKIESKQQRVQWVNDSSVGSLYHLDVYRQTREGSRGYLQLLSL